MQPSDVKRLALHHILCLQDRANTEHQIRISFRRHCQTLELFAGKVMICLTLLLVVGQAAWLFCRVPWHGPAFFLVCSFCIMCCVCRPHSLLACVHAVHPRLLLWERGREAFDHPHLLPSFHTHSLGIATRITPHSRLHRPLSYTNHGAGHTHDAWHT